MNLAHMDFGPEMSRYSNETLLRAYTVLTHRVHALREQNGQALRAAREERELLQAEILRRMES